MYFDGSIKPRRVVRQSGVSYLENGLFGADVLKLGDKRPPKSQLAQITKIKNLCLVIATRRRLARQFAAEMSSIEAVCNSCIHESTQFYRSKQWLDTTPLVRYLRLAAYTLRHGRNIDINRNIEYTIDAALWLLQELESGPNHGQFHLGAVELLRLQKIYRDIFHGVAWPRQHKQILWYLRTNVNDLKPSQESLSVEFCNAVLIAEALLKSQGGVLNSKPPRNKHDYIRHHWVGVWWPNALIHLVEIENYTLAGQLANTLLCQHQGVSELLELAAIFWSIFPIDVDSIDFNTLQLLLECTIDPRLATVAGFGSQETYATKQNNAETKIPPALKTQILEQIERHPKALVQQKNKLDLMLSELDLSCSLYACLHFQCPQGSLSVSLYSKLLDIVNRIDFFGGLFDNRINLDAILALLGACKLSGGTIKDLPATELSNQKLKLESLVIKILENRKATKITRLLALDLLLPVDFRQLSTCFIHGILSQSLQVERVVEFQPLEFLDRMLALFIAARVPSLLLEVFCQHFVNCCKGDFAVLYSQVQLGGFLGQSFHLLICILMKALAFLRDDEICPVNSLDDFDFLTATKTNPTTLLTLDQASTFVRCLHNLYWLQHSGTTVDVSVGYSEIEKFPKDSFVVSPLWCCINCKCGCCIPIVSTTSPRSCLHQKYILDGKLVSKVTGHLFSRVAALNDLYHSHESQYTVQAACERFSHACMEDPGWPEFLATIPFAISFGHRLDYMYRSIVEDKRMNRNGIDEYIGGVAYIIRRNFLLEDAMATLGTLNSHEIKQIFKVVFVDENGVQEQGVDGGGLFKEFLTLACNLIFDVNYGIFNECNNTYVPNPNSGVLHPNHLDILHFIGKMIGKAIYEGIFVDAVFSRLVLNLMLKRRNTMDDLRIHDPELHRQLLSLLKMTPEELEALDLSFECTRQVFGTEITTPLIPNGSQVRVDKSNVQAYIYHYSDFCCNTEIETQCVALLHGIAMVIPLDWLSIFSPMELELVISGSQRPVDVDDLKRNTNYANGFDPYTATIQWFWQVLKEWDPDTVRRFLYFCTCSKRVPLQGFKRLQPKFCIAKEPTAHRMPTVSTCLNLLKICEYPDKQSLAAALVNAMDMTKGFGIH